MAIFLGAQGEDILSWRGNAELLGELRDAIAGMKTSMLLEESTDLLKSFKVRLEEEVAFEESFAAELARAEEDLRQAEYEDDFSPLLARFDRLARDYFLKRGSVVALHSLCNSYRDNLVRRVAEQVEAALELDEMRKPPAPYCLLAAGSAGRKEQTLCVDPGYLLIYGDTDEDGPGYFEKFAWRAAALLGKIGMLPEEGGAAIMKSLWRGGRKAWREEVVSGLQRREQKGVELLLERADLRLVHGDAPLAGEMINVVRSMLDFSQWSQREPASAAAGSFAAPTIPAPVLREVGRSIAETPTGLDFFGRLKVEKGGRYRGRFDLEQYALAPLIANIRLQAIDAGLAETSTIDRIKGLQGVGRLSVELSERLLHAYHDFSRMKILLQIREGGVHERPCHINPRELDEEGDQKLRTGLEAVSDLEKITYLRFADHG
jgi:signal-transduction protein with cAMP-binding, CBS, and nucleotidyltransferase domain